MVVCAEEACTENEEITRDENTLSFGWFNRVEGVEGVQYVGEGRRQRSRG